MVNPESSKAVFFTAPELLFMLLTRHLDHNISFHDIQFLHLVKVFKYQAAFKSCFYFFHIILKPLQGGKCTFVDLFAFLLIRILQSLWNMPSST